MNTLSKDLPIAVIGAGPVGLAAAAHLLEQGITPIVLERSASVAASFESFRHVRLFSPWRYNIDWAARRLLAKTGWIEPTLDALPTAGDMLDRYLRPLAESLSHYVLLRHRVLRIARHGFDKVKTKGRESAPFLLQVETPEGERDITVRAVIDASGTWLQPNPLGASGLPVRGEAELQIHIRYGMPDILGAERARYAGKRTLVVGAGHSAAGNLIALTELAAQEPGTTAIWAIRGDGGSNLARIFGGGDADGLPARGKLGAHLRELKQSGRLEFHANFRAVELRAGAHGMRIMGEAISGATPAIDNIDEIIVAAGSRPDLEMTRELRLKLDPWLESTDALAPLIDPNLHSCGTVRPHGHRELAHPEFGYYAAGAKSYGRAPNFLLATGYEQVRSIAAALAGDMVAADDVRLELPQTGVCSSGLLSSVLPSAQDGGCCGGPAPTGTDTCCVLDADEKASGKAGCGCNGPASQPARKEKASNACCG